MKAIRAITVLAGALALVLGLTVGTASAHDFVPSASTPVCTVLNGAPVKIITITVTNQYDLPATGTSARISGSTFPIPAGVGSTGSYTLRNSATATGSGTDGITVTWSDGFTISHVVTYSWGDAACAPPPPATTTPPETTVPPPETTVPPEAPPTTVAPPDTVTPDTPTTPPETELVPPVVINQPPIHHSTPTTHAPALPSTGSTPVPVLVSGLGALALGAGLVVFSTRRRAA